MSGNNLISITVNDKVYQVPAGLSIIQAADRLGICIPRFCYLEKLSPLGGCRMCLITVQGIPKLQTACTAPARDGMVVITESEEIDKARKATLELQLAQHPLDCFHCDKATRCDLQDLTYLFGDIRHRYDFPRKDLPTIYDNPLIERNLGRCVHCERCVRVCEEIQGADAISATRRGRPTEMREVPGGGECQHCGHCVDVCPVGANLDRLFSHRGRPFQMEEALSICPYCGCGCTLSLNTREGRIMRVWPRGDEGVNHGSLCARGRFGWGFVNHPERLARPRIKKDGQLVEVDWDEALLFTATRLEKIIREHGPQSVGGLGSVRATDEANYLFQRFMRCVVGNNNIDSSARLGYTAGLTGRLGVAGDVREATLDDVRCAARLLVIGADPVETNPILGLAMKAGIRKGATVVVADPRTTLTSRWAVQHLRIRPGSEVPLILALARRLLNEPELSAFKDADLLARIGLKTEELTALAGMLEGEAGEQTVVLAGRGVTQAPYGASAVAALLRIVAKQGASYLLTVDRNNERGSCEAGVLPDRLPGLAPLSERGRFEKVWGQKVPEQPGLSAYEMLQAAREGKLKAFYIMGENPVDDFPDTRYVEEALSSAEFLVVQDLFMTPTAVLADVVLPSASFAEKAGQFTNLEGRVQHYTAVIPPVGEARPDARILVELSRKMGKGFPHKDIVEVREEMNNLVPIKESKRQLACNGLSHAVPGPEVQWGPVEDSDFPYLLLTTASLYRNGAESNLAVGLQKGQERAALRLHPADAQGLGVSDGDSVMVTSKTGEIQVSVRLDDEIAPGTLQLAEGFADANPRSLLGHALDPVTRTPMARYVQVKMRKL
jgi:formate dehydrogenase alpha subunit